MFFIAQPRIVLLSFFLCGAMPLSPTSVQQTPREVVACTHNTNIYPTVTATASSSAINVVDMMNVIKTNIRQVCTVVSQTAQDTFSTKNRDLLKKLLKDWAWEHRYRIAGGTILGSYSAMSLLLIADYHHLTTMHWAHWRQEQSFEQLCAIPQKELAKELLLSIGEHHFNKNNPTDLAYPLIAFIKDIDWEVDIIKRYIFTTRFIKKIGLMPIFPTNENKLNRAIKMLERVLFIKHIFLSWLADYHLTHTEKINIK